MKNEKNFDDILKSKFDDRQVPFDEQNWQSMRQMIDTSRADKRRVLWLVASLTLLLCAGGGIAMYSLSKAKGNATPNYAVTTSTNASQSKANNNSVQANNIGSKTANTAQPTNSPASSNMAIANSNTTVGTNKTTNTFANGQITGSGGTLNNPYIKKSKHFTKKEREGINITSNNAISSNISNQNATNASNNTKAGSLQNATGSSLTNTTQAVAAEPSSAKTSETESKTNASLAKSNANKLDSVTSGNVLPQRFSDEPRVFQGKSNFLSVDAAIEYAGGWQIGSVVQGKGLNFTVGLGYEHYLGSRIFMKTGLQFSTFGNMSPLTYNYEHSAGNIIYDSVITTERLYFLKIPIQAEYFVGRKKKSSIGAGGSVWILLGNSGYATTFQQADNNPPVNIVRHPENASLDGYKEFDISAHVFYRYVLSRKFSMYFILYQELTNMKDNSFFGENIIQRSKGVQYMLSYNLN